MKEKPKKSVFKTEFDTRERPEDPESLFRDLKKSLTSNLKHLWSHQADLLREYNKKHLKTPNLALELPTGAGKTLVGLLIADFRRRKFDERVVYLCPTRQLAGQVGAHAAEYGIPAHVLVGRQANYPSAKFREYKESTATAITTYSGLFNTSPKIDDPHVIILDDAHAGENYISDLWSVEITRDAQPQAFKGIIDLMRDVLPSAFDYQLHSDDVPLWGKRDVELLPGPYLRQKETALRDLLESLLPKGESAWFSWQLVKDHLHACNLYISWTNVLFRPIIPPAKTHPPFKQARQRVYMSATLGSGGELERITGVEHIARLPIPAGWDKQGSGRRLILMPELSLEPTSTIPSTVECIEEAKRALVLVPNDILRRSTTEEFISQDIKVLGAPDIEESLEGFTNQNDCALVLANRYDGLDLPDEACRLLVIMGLPCGTNLQETFLLSRLAATSLLRDRVLTRLSQGFGRCTRSDSDYAAVFLLGSELIEFLLKAENRSCLHPELQAELDFGIENSKDITEDDLQRLFKAFLEQAEDWNAAEKTIIGLRTQKKRTSDEVAERLMAVASDEVSYVYALWGNDYETALEKAKSISDRLEGNETQGYRGWWYYLHGDSALMLHGESADQKLASVARDSFRRAAKCAPSVSWLAELARLKVDGQLVATTKEVDPATPRALEAIRRQLSSLGLAGKGFEKKVKSLLVDIGKDEASAFHRGLGVLGQLLGFEAELPKGSGTPDCVWSLGDSIHVVHEAKTGQDPKNPIAKKHVQQATGHREWMKANRPHNPATRIICLLEAARETLQPDAVPHAKELYHVTPWLVRDIATELVSVLRSVRAKSIDAADEKFTEALLQGLNEHGLLPNQLIDRLTRQPVAKLKVIGK